MTDTDYWHTSVCCSVLVNHWFGKSLEHKIILPVIDRPQGLADQYRSSISNPTFFFVPRIECLHNIGQNDTDIRFNRESDS